MHELSIADAVLAIVAEHAGERRVVRVDVEVGYLRQVVPGALAFAFELLSQGTVAEGAELVVHEVAVEAECRRCGASGGPKSFPLRCAACGSLELEIVKGEELSVDSLEVADPQPVGEEEECATPSNS
jgi:hydrogenase nickel incorporation protein HypA/HybF